MPLVVPGLMTSGTNAKSSDNTNSAWMNKLMGKKLTDGASDETNFSKKDLPKEYRVIEHNSATTQEHVSDRLNIYLGPDGTVMNTSYDDGRS